ncbi:MAG: T9SS type A sorting domain-containing protein [Candidatus Marinimicrobia bacterium]|nr:T9SS type A sorting domain-containing protein [Candidatus Neomarinimicrobiota bacterium]
MRQNYPNPFNPACYIRYRLPETQRVLLNVYSVSGARVRTLVDGIQEAGYYTLKFHAGDLPGGLYIYRMRAGADVQTKKMILLK